jgi:hypothetical protein
MIVERIETRTGNPRLAGQKKPLVGSAHFPL